METLSLVTHESPDADANAAIFVYLKAVGIDVWDVILNRINTQIVFVPHGERWLQKNENEKVLHFDTGGLCDYISNFDHHGPAENEPSATQAVANAFPFLQKDKAIMKLCERINEIDSGGRVRKKQTDYSAKEQTNLINLAKKFNSEKRRDVKVFVVKQKELQDYLEIMSNFELENDEISSLDKMNFGLISLETWYQKQNGQLDQIPKWDSPEGQLFLRCLYVFVKMQVENKTPYDYYKNEIINLCYEAKFGDKQNIGLNTLLWQNKNHPRHGKLFSIIAKFCNLYCSPAGRIDTDVEFFAQHMKKLIKSEDLEIVSLYPGPWSILRLFPDIGQIPMLTLIRYLLGCFKSWSNKIIGNDKIAELLGQNQIVKINGVKTLLLPETTIRSGYLRYKLRRHRGNIGVDLIISKHLWPKSGKTNLAITKLTSIDDKWEINGFTELVNEIISEVGEDKSPFLHSEKFVIYAEEIIAFDKLVDLAQKTIYFLPKIEKTVLVNNEGC